MSLLIYSQYGANERLTAQTPIPIASGLVPLLLLCVGLAAPAAENLSFCSGFRSSFFRRQKQRRKPARRYMQLPAHTFSKD